MRLIQRAVLLLFTCFVLSACSVSSVDRPGETPPVAEAHEVAALAQQIKDLGPEVDPAEASRAAQIAYDYTHQLSRQYEIVDSPLIHNAKVNAGLRERGLCWHWAEDVEARLKQEDFRTLTLHRAIANHDKPLRIEHSTAIISRAGDDLYQGVVLDPWRKGGVLFWSLVEEDNRYEWYPRENVLAYKRGELNEVPRQLVVVQ